MNFGRNGKLMRNKRIRKSGRQDSAGKRNPVFLYPVFKNGTLIFEREKKCFLLY